VVSDYERDLAFLRHCIRYDQSDKRHQLEEGIRQVQRKDRCVRRVAWLMALLTALSGAGLAYGAVLQDNFSYGNSGFFIKVLCELGLASLICLVAFVGLLMAYRMELNRLREQCRHVAATLLESRLGKPASILVTEVTKEQAPDSQHGWTKQAGQEM